MRWLFLFLFICFTQYQHADVEEAGASDTNRHAIVLEQGKHNRTAPSLVIDRKRKRKRKSKKSEESEATPHDVDVIGRDLNDLKWAFFAGSAPRGDVGGVR